MDWTSEQEQIIRAKDQRIKAVAGPGTGKTTTMVGRAQEQGSTLLLVFTKAAQEDAAGRMPVGSVAKTLHAHCFGLIREDYWKMGYSRPPGVTSWGLFRGLQEATGESYRGWDKSPWDEEWLQEANETLTTEELEGLKQDPLLRISASALLQFREMLHQADELQFCDMLRIAVEKGLMWDGGYKHLIVDEFQDIDDLQLRLLDRWADQVTGAGGSVCYVGDPNQRIFGWRGAIHVIFDRVTGTTLPLLTSFRSRDEIIENAESLIPVGLRGVRGPGGRVERECGLPAPFLTGPLHTRAVLCRTNREVGEQSIRLARKNVPTRSLGLEGYFKAPHVRLTLELRQKGVMNPEQVYGHGGWERLQQTKRWREDERVEAQAREDVEWILGLTDPDLRMLRKNTQNPRGITLATIHKTKGLEWDEVAINNAQTLEANAMKDPAELLVLYVAATRPRERLLLLEG